MKRVLCSGGFDPLHVGHLNYLREAGKLGTVVVALNSDAWLVRKKGYAFMSWGDRAAILFGLSCVGTVILIFDDDDTVCQTLRSFRPDIYANGGDRTEAVPAENAVCKEIGIEQLFNVGGGKIASSSALVKNCLDYHQNALQG